MGQIRLLATRRFGALFAAQFAGALNDNLIKNALVVALAFQSARFAPGTDPALVANLAPALFVLPFFLFSATAAAVADRFERRSIAAAVKVLELACAGAAAAALAFGSLTLALATLFMLGTHSAFFGPVKYALLPQLLSEDELVGGNALVEAGTFLAILAGAIAGGAAAAAAFPAAALGIPAAALAGAGMAAALSIPRMPAVDPKARIDPNLAKATASCVAETRRHGRATFLSVLGISWFWLLGALVLAQIPQLARETLGGGESAVSALLAFFAVGVGAGSLLCERLSAGRVEIGLVVPGALLVSCGAAALALVPSVDPAGAALTLSALSGEPAAWAAAGALALLGFGGGPFIVPLYALVQQRTAPESMARVVAGNNILNAAFMVAGAASGAALLAAGTGLSGLFAAAACANLAVGWFAVRAAPEFALRFAAWAAARAAYPIDRSRPDPNLAVPASGAALAFFERSSSADEIFLAAALRRPCAFARDPGEDPPGRLAPWFVSGMGRLDSSGGAFAARQALSEGRLVAVEVPEDGAVPEWALDAIRAGTPAIACSVRGLDGSIFSDRPDGLGARLRRRSLAPAVSVEARLLPAGTSLVGDLRRLLDSWRRDA